MVYTLRFFSSKCSLFHNSNVFGSCIIHILYTGCAKIKKNNSGAKRLIFLPHYCEEYKLWCYSLGRSFDPLVSFCLYFMLRVLVGNPEGRKPLRRRRCNIKICLKEIVRDGMNLIHLAQYKKKCCVLIATMNLRVASKAGNFFKNWGTVSYVGVS